MLCGKSVLPKSYKLAIAPILRIDLRGHYLKGKDMKCYYNPRIECQLDRACSDCTVWKRIWSNYGPDYIELIEHVKKRSAEILTGGPEACKAFLDRLGVKDDRY